MNALNIPAPDLEPRLQGRFRQLVEEHLHSNGACAAGSKALPGTVSALAGTQAAWRFYHNPEVSLPALAAPLLEQGRGALATDCQTFGLVAHDWSSLSFNTHAGKADRVQLQHSRHHGYELQSSLLVSDRTGLPLAPLCQSLRARDGLHTSRSERVDAAGLRLEELTRRMGYLEGLQLGRPLVHIVDRESDSVGHFRHWEKAGWNFLVRAKGARRVRCGTQSRPLRQLVQTLQGALSFVREVEVKGKAARQYVGETQVILEGPARPTRPLAGRSWRKPVPGEPVRLRLIVSQVRDDREKILATWLLYSNVPAGVGAGELALWYHWRWQIESFFKLLKSAGQQERAPAFARRLLVASMACVLVWQIARDPTPAALELRQFLIRLSGRQMKRRRPWTAPALLEGLWVLLAMREALRNEDPEKLLQYLDELV
jgi:hypothetical protein